MSDLRVAASFLGGCIMTCMNKAPQQRMPCTHMAQFNCLSVERMASLWDLSGAEVLLGQS